MTVKEYMEAKGVTRRTVYRWIDENKIKARKIGDMWDIYDDSGDIIDEKSDMSYSNNTSSHHTTNNIQYDAIETELRERIKDLQAEVEYLREELSNERQRHDTIVLSLSNQLSEEKKKLEDRTNELYEEQKKLEDRTKQLTEKQKLIEELRNQTIWRRLKMAFGFTS